MGCRTCGRHALLVRHRQAAARFAGLADLPVEASRPAFQLKPADNQSAEQQRCQVWHQQQSTSSPCRTCHTVPTIAAAGQLHTRKFHQSSLARGSTGAALTADGPSYAAPHAWWRRQLQGLAWPFGTRTHFATALSAGAFTPGVEARLQQLVLRHAELSQALVGEDTASMGSAQLAALSKEAGELAPLAAAHEALQAARRELADLEALARDGEEGDDMRRLAADEATALRLRVPALERAVLDQLVPVDAAEAGGAVLEVRAGTGGEEAALFAAELFRMYAAYAAARHWSFEVAELAEAEAGGLRLASAQVGGRGAYGALRHESGIHRVQRVPATEASGRLHTSAASVAVLPLVASVEVAVRDEDLRIDTFRASGAGGQHVNTTNSAVRITHMPSGLVVAIQDERSQHKNKAKAMSVLRARLASMQSAQQAASQSAQRKGQIGSGDRSERIRTYNFPQGRVTDHRVGITEHGIDAVMSGARLHVFIDALVQHRRSQQLEALAQPGYN